MSTRLALVVAAATLALPAPARAQFERVPITVVRPGGGLLSADGVSRIPLHIVLVGADEGPGIRSARIVASEGEITNTEVLGAGRVACLYAPPARRGRLDEIFDVALELDNGNTIAEAFTLAVPAPSTPRVELSATPSGLTSTDEGPVRLQATAYGQDLVGVTLQATKGDLTVEPETGRGGTRVVNGTLALPTLPPDAPSHFVAAAIAATDNGYTVAVEDIPVAAPVRLSVRIPRGRKLTVTGARNRPPPVTAPADGKTVMEDVQVDLTSPLKVYAQRGRRKKQLSVVVPTGVISPGVVAAIPGQAVSDGGTGPTVVVALPPGSFGAPVFWPDIEVEGAELVGTEDLSERVKALVLTRPTEPRTVRILLDGLAAGEIELDAARGAQVRLSPLAADKDERAAVSVVVTTARGAPTNLPVPKVRLARGKPLEVERVAPGRYRAHVPIGTPGKPGTEEEVVAELPPMPLVTGAPLEYARDSATVTLAGPPPAVVAEEAPPPVVREPPTRVPDSARTRFGIAAVGAVGTSFSLLVVGGGAQFEVRPPFLRRRLLFRAGLEYVRGSGSGRVTFDENRNLPANLTVAGLLFPVEVGYAIVDGATVEMVLRAGGALRVEQGGLSIQDDAAGAGRRVGFGARGGLDLGFHLGGGTLFVGATADGLGASLGGFSTPAVTLEGSYFTLRGDVGYRFWF